MTKILIDKTPLTVDSNYKSNFSISSSPDTYLVKFDYLPKTFDKNDVLLVDKNVQNLYNINHDKIITIEANEENKSIFTSLEVSEKLLNFGFNKGNRLAVIGGGITQDIGAYTAKTFKRGVEWILYPTTLLSQCDSCIGAKSALNFKKYKNQIGLFSAPSEVVIDTNFLNTLSEQDILSGYGEIVKLFCIGGKEFLETIETDSKEKLIYNSLSIKKSIIEHDEFEKHERKCLNFGHSFGHAIETLTNFSIPHGEAVMLGMQIINQLFDNNEQITQIINKFTTLQKIKHIDTNLLLQNLKTDKKTYGNNIVFVRVPTPGRCVFTKTEINDSLLQNINNIFSKY
jgi:3-dehydroquinate synthase